MTNPPSVRLGETASKIVGNLACRVARHRARGSVIVALEAARNLNLADVTIPTMDTDLLDIDGTVQKLGLDSGRAD